MSGSGEERPRRPEYPCEECGATAAAGGETTCVCEAEGFGPLRVRPYVTLPEPSQPPPPRAPDPYARPPLPPGRTGADEDDDAPEPPPPRRPPVLLLAALAGVLSVAALVTVLISSGDGDTGATAQEAGTPLSATTPAPAPSGTSPRPSAPASERTARPAPPRVSRAASAVAAPSPSATASRPPASPTRSPSASARTSAPPSASASATPRPSRSQRREPEVLRRGDRGPEVGELQYRLRKVNLYPAEPDGRFDDRTESAVRNYQMARGVRGDAPGTYGPATRRLLEAETR
ncbi:peptidoglycan-binding protein [Streptomyces sp. NPDC046939]|uniref:peptidoglycan-binding domain-containing protein n=1 Tax=Streptomyces sp. NPDC046939 TaxID=3155376 RepID=UPI0033FA5374